ncbi:hypothetical protein Scep_026456 [Stephania cephalantha]|uniref:CCD97-like C-terminal domain-containing protein n=1 Tax=Stephania cephalantha TaxID=152367 RepID=A0AAP0ENC4_9MAGN
MQETATTTAIMEEEAMAERLSSLDTLYFPRSFQPSAATPSQRKSILLDLLRRDPAVFLERYGDRLTADELRQFEAKRGGGSGGGDYEAGEGGELLLGGRDEGEGAVPAPRVFGEVSGREREGDGAAGERWSETLLRRCEEAVLVEKIRAEQMRLGVDEKDWVNPNGVNNARAGEETHKKTRLSEAEMQDQMENFTYIMQQKFLSGEDTEHLDYSKIDNDETLDDHWLREADLDAEDKYFSED